MARVRETFPTTFNGYPHREHRSKGGRRKIIKGEDKMPAYFIQQERDEELLDQEGETESLAVSEFKEKLTLEDVFDLELAPKKKSDTYPKLVCENCGHHNQLNFAPNKDGVGLATVRCKQCLDFAYYTHYWQDIQIKDFRIFIFHSWIRELVKSSNITLANILSV